MAISRHMGVVILQRLLLWESWSLPSNMLCLIGYNLRQELDDMGARDMRNGEKRKERARELMK